ncbi:Sugar fermentation stimulation protein A [compost metagenome]
MNISSRDFQFTASLLEGVIQKKKNRFIMIVELDGELHDCHCPVTGSIGNIVFNDIPCLVSRSNDPKRKTQFTVEAISLDLPSVESKAWIGINQNAANRYIEHFITNGSFKEMIGDFQTVIRETKLGISKLDFLVGQTYVEVKTPLTTLHVEMGDHIVIKKSGEFNSFERLIKHIGELSGSLSQNERAIMIICMIYKNNGFKVGNTGKHSGTIMQAVQSSIQNGVEIWQVNLQLRPEGVSLTGYYSITDQFITGEIISN